MLPIQSIAAIRRQLSISTASCDLARVAWLCSSLPGHMKCWVLAFMLVLVLLHMKSMPGTTPCW
jgi:hypothetical protein